MIIGLGWIGFFSNARVLLHDRLKIIRNLPGFSKKCFKLLDDISFIWLGCFQIAQPMTRKCKRKITDTLHWLPEERTWIEGQHEGEDCKWAMSVNSMGNSEAWRRMKGLRGEAWKASESVILSNLNLLLTSYAHTCKSVSTSDKPPIIRYLLPVWQDSGTVTWLSLVHVGVRRY